MKKFISATLLSLIASSGLVFAQIASAEVVKQVPTPVSASQPTTKLTPTPTSASKSASEIKPAPKKKSTKAYAPAPKYKVQKKSSIHKTSTPIKP